MKAAKRNRILMDVAPGLRAILSGTAVLAGVIITAAPAIAVPIPVVNGNFSAPLFDEDGGGGLADWYWVPSWDEGGASFYGSGGGGFLYCDAGGWVSQNLGYSWTAADVFTLGVKGNQGWRSGGTFKIQLRQADGTVLWDSGTVSVDSTWQDFSWNIDASTFSGAGVVSGSQLNLRIECLNNTVYIDDVTLSTSLADTTAPTLAGSAMVDNKSGGPVNPGEVVTYTVTFSEAMDSATVSAGDFDNGGTAAVLIGSPATTDGVNYQIPVVASSTGTLQLRVPVGATLTDLAGIPLDTGSAILDDTTIDVVAKPIAVTGGDFEVPAITGQPGDVPFWFDSNYAYADWHNAAQYSANGSQTALMQYFGGYLGYVYQSLGQLVAGSSSLDWSFDQVKGNGTAELRFFYGVSPAAGQGVDIDTLGFTQIGNTVSFPGTSDNVVFRSGSVDVSAVPAGATIWMDFTHAGGAEFLLDNIVTLIDTPTAYQAWLAANSKTNTPENLREYAFGTTNTGALVLNGAGTSIVTRGQAPIITTTVGSAVVTLTYARRKNSGCTYRAEFSTDLTTWLESTDSSLIYPPGAPAGETVVDNGDEMEIVSIKFPLFRDTGSGYVKMEQNFCRTSVTIP